MLGLLGALDPYKHKLNQTGGMLVDGDSAAISKDITDNDAGKNNALIVVICFCCLFCFVLFGLYLACIDPLATKQTIKQANGNKTLHAA